MDTSIELQTTSTPLPLRVQIFSDIGAETSKLHAKEEKNSMSARLTDILLGEIFKAFAAAICKAAVEVALKHGKRILNRLMGRSDNEADDGLENNHERLAEQAEDLFSRRDDILAQTETKLVSQECEDWISRVETLEKEVRESSESSTILSKSMEKKRKELRLLLKKEHSIGIQAKKSPQRVLLVPQKPKSEDKRFLDPIVENILNNLRDKTVKIIGLCGKSIIGKTTIMESLNNNENIARMFDIVIFITVSEDLGFEKLQHKIAKRLKLDLEGITDPSEIFDGISRRLKSKRYLLLLDDVSGSLKSILDGLYENAMDSKVVLTAASRRPCVDMNAYPIIPVEPMSNAVAWEIFKEKVGQNVNLQRVKPIAEKVVMECQGIPSVIDKVASNFKGRDSYELWEDGYEKLQSWSGTNINDIDLLLRYQN